MTGGSGSGKSAYAESLLSGFENISSRYYIATMQVYGEEGKKRVERHRRLRAGKGFITSEQTVQIDQALKKFKDSDKISYAALVECVSNLTANEMFDENGQRSEVEVVTNNVFDDGITYDESTMAYIRALARINIELAAWADEVTEVVAGCPVMWKKPDDHKNN